MYRALLLLVSLMAFSVVSADEIELKFDRTQFSLEEPFELTITSSNANSGTIDISALSQDFDVLSQHKQTSMQIINGVVSQSTTLILTVAAKQAGDIIIPSMTIGQDVTKEKKITIGDETPTDQGKDILLEAAVEQESAYVQGQIIYVQRLLFTRDFRSNSTLTRPRLTDGRAEIESLGNTPEQLVQRDGRDYRMITRRYAIIPQESGKIVFAPTVFGGTTRGTSVRQRDQFGYTSASKYVQIRSNEVEVEIKPRPASFTGKDWIVAKNLSLHLNWPIPVDQLKAGEPVTVVLAAIADGLRAEQLSEIEFDVPDGIKQYPEKPTFNNIRKRDGIVGTVNKSIVLVPAGGGEFEIPEVRIPWWNSLTDKEEVAVLAATTIKVSGKPVALPVQKAVDLPKSAEEASNNEIADKPSVSKTIILLGILALLSLIALTVWLIVKKKKSPVVDLSGVPDSNVIAADLTQVLADLKEACLTNNAASAQQHLQNWASAIGVFPATLENLSSQTTESLSLEINNLSQSLYSREADAWQGRKLWEEVALYNSRVNQADQLERSEHELEPLYL